jgi:RNA polymerase sigma-70 factor (ECF subfamily)
MAMIAAEKVRAAVDRLPPEQRRAIELAYFEGLSCSEISTAISIPVGTVKSRMAAAMAKLRAALADAGSTPARGDATGRPELS